MKERKKEKKKIPSISDISFLSTLKFFYVVCTFLVDVFIVPRLFSRAENQKKMRTRTTVNAGLAIEFRRGCAHRANADGASFYYFFFSFLFLSLLFLSFPFFSSLLFSFPSTSPMFFERF